MKILVLLLALFIPAHMVPAMIPNDNRIELPPPSQMYSAKPEYEDQILESEEDPIQGVDGGSEDDGEGMEEFTEGIMVTWVAFVFLSVIALFGFMAKKKD